jgi:hypothetical protein
MSAATLGNVVHLILSLPVVDKEEFCEIYFPDLGFKYFELYLETLNKFRNHIVHVGKVIGERDLFKDIYDMKRKEEAPDFKEYEHIFGFHLIYAKLMGPKATATLQKEINRLFAETKNAKHLIDYGHSIEIKVELMKLSEGEIK